MANEKLRILGQWRIVEMEQWEQDFIDAEMPGFIRFDAEDMGEFHFGYVHGQMDCKPTERDGKPAVEWSFEGHDEMDPTSGRGWAMLQDERTLVGRLFFHLGDDSAFRATKSGDDTPQPPRLKLPTIKLHRQK